MQTTHTCDHCGDTYPLDEMFHVDDDLLARTARAN